MEGLGRQGWGSERLRLARALVSYIVTWVKVESLSKQWFDPTLLFCEYVVRTTLQKIVSASHIKIFQSLYEGKISARCSSSPLEKSFSRPPEVCKKGHRSVRINCDDEGFAANLSYCGCLATKGDSTKEDILYQVILLTAYSQIPTLYLWHASCM